MKKNIPIYNICSIDKSVNSNVLIQPLKEYLKKHYANLNTPHRHSFYHLVLFTSGKGSHTIDFESFKIINHQVYFMIPGQVHSWHFESEMKGYIIHFEPEFFTSFFQKQDYVDQFPFFSGSSRDGVLTIPTRYQHEIRTIFEQLLTESNNQVGSLDLVRVLLIELFILIERYCAPAVKRDAQSSNAIMITNFKKLVDKQFRTLRLPKDYARLLYITPNHLNAISQDVLGKSAGDVIRDRIVLEAKRLLTNATMDVSEIAYDLNFQDNSYFNRFFKKYVGTTPDQFRKTFHR
jgi:AraC family transcriptional regulator, transcriptional activator of pobA